jgi:hypothetical protein
MTVMMICAKVKCEQVADTCPHRHRLRCLAAQLPAVSSAESRLGAPDVQRSDQDSCTAHTRCCPMQPRAYLDSSITEPVDTMDQDSRNRPGLDTSCPLPWALGRVLGSVPLALVEHCSIGTAAQQGSGVDAAGANEQIL